jgi:hypothetical protein
MYRVVIVCLALVLGASSAKAELEQVAKFLAEKYDTTMILPFGAKSTTEGAKQVGAVYTDLKFRQLGSSRAFRWQQTGVYCANAPDTFKPEAVMSTKDFVWKVAADLKIKASVKNVFELLDIQADYIDTIKLSLKDARTTTPPPSLLISKILDANWADQDFCRRQVFCGPAPTQVVTGVTEAIVDIELYFKAGVKLSVVNLTMSKIGLTLGLEASASTQQGEGPDKPWKLSSDGKHVVVGFNFVHWRKLMSREKYVCP